MALVQTKLAPVLYLSLASAGLAAPESPRESARAGLRAVAMPEKAQTAWKHTAGQNAAHATVKFEAGRRSRSSSQLQPEPACLRAGWLTKKGGYRRNWKRRWFELQLTALLYYEEQPGKAGTEPKGRIELAEVEDARASERPKATAAELELITHERTFWLTAETEGEGELWLASIKERLADELIPELDDPLDEMFGSAEAPHAAPPLGHLQRQAAKQPAGGRARASTGAEGVVMGKAAGPPPVRGAKAAKALPALLPSMEEDEEGEPPVASELDDQKARFKALMYKIETGTATDADNIEIEKLSDSLFGGEGARSSTKEPAAAPAAKKKSGKKKAKKETKKETKKEAKREAEKQLKEAKKEKKIEKKKPKTESGGAADKARLEELMGKIEAGNASDADNIELEKLSDAVRFNHFHLAYPCVYLAFPCVYLALPHFSSAVRRRGGECNSRSLSGGATTGS